MPDSLTSTGLTVETLSEIKANLNAGLQSIYGSDINLDQNSPDGQLVGIIAQAAVDIRELITNVYNSFDPDRAVGTVLDERCVINNIERKGGTFTVVPIDIIVSATVTLQGLDASINDVNGTGYTIQDNAGNQYILENTATFTAGTTTVNFRAQAIGQVLPTLNTINIPTTIVLGVTSVNNSLPPISVGENQETDAQFRVRRQQSVALGSVGYLNGLLGAVLDLTGVTDAKLYENITNSVDADGIPAHGIWLIVEGGANSDIATQIYNRKSYGANMKGSVTYPITTASGGTFTAQWDIPTGEPLYIQFTVQTIIVVISYYYYHSKRVIRLK